MSSLPLLDRIFSVAARRYHLSADDAEEFRSWATLRLVADDFAVLAKFRGESALSTYLTSVVVSLLRDYRHATEGRWRSSARALRAGELGIRLERLLVRDGIPLRQAGELLRTAGVTTMSDRQLAVIAVEFPRRDCLRPIRYLGDIDGCLERSGHEGYVEPEADEDAGERRSGVMRALATLPRDELKLIELVFWKQLSVAQVARTLGVPQKPLYRRLQRILKRLRRAVETMDEYQAS